MEPLLDLFPEYIWVAGISTDKPQTSQGSLSARFIPHHLRFHFHHLTRRHHHRLVLLLRVRRRRPRRSPREHPPEPRRRRCAPRQKIVRRCRIVVAICGRRRSDTTEDDGIVVELERDLDHFVAVDVSSQVVEVNRQHCAVDGWRRRRAFRHVEGAAVLGAAASKRRRSHHIKLRKFRWEIWKRKLERSRDVKTSTS